MKLRDTIHDSESLLRELFAMIHRRKKMTASAFQKALKAGRAQVMNAATTCVP